MHVGDIKGLFNRGYLQSETVNQFTNPAFNSNTITPVCIPIERVKNIRLLADYPCRGIKVVSV